MRSVRSFIELHTNVGIQKWNTQKMASNDTPVSFRFISNEIRQLETVLFPGYKLLNMYVCTFIANGWLWESTDRYHEFNLINLLKRCRHFNFNLVRCWVALDLQWDKENFSHCWMQILESILPKIATSKRETKNTYIDSIYTEKRIPNSARDAFVHFVWLWWMSVMYIKNRSTILQFTFACVTDWAGKRFSISQKSQPLKWSLRLTKRYRKRYKFYFKFRRIKPKRTAKLYGSRKDWKKCEWKVIETI